MTYDDIMTTSKAPAKKITAKKPAKAASPLPPAPVEQSAPEAGTLRTITFLGREMAVKLPLPEQIAAWQRLLKRLEGMDPATSTGEDALKMLSRTDTIIDAVLVSDEDKEWLEDERLAGRATLQNTPQIVLDALTAFKDDRPEPANRAARRARK